MTDEIKQVACDAYGHIAPGQVRVSISLKGFGDPSIVDKSLIFITDPERAEDIFRVAAETATRKWEGTHDKLEEKAVRLDKLGILVDPSERDLHGGGSDSSS